MATCTTSWSWSWSSPSWSYHHHHHHHHHHHGQSMDFVFCCFSTNHSVPDRSVCLNPVSHLYLFFTGWVALHIDGWHNNYSFLNTSWWHMGVWCMMCKVLLPFWDQGAKVAMQKGSKQTTLYKKMHFTTVFLWV